MRDKSLRLTLAPLALALLANPSCHPSAPADPDLASAAHFVQAFYSWYIPSTKRGSGLQVALRDSAALFAPAIVTALQADAAAQARHPDEVTGLDGDPFLNAQDFCDSAAAYVVGGARRDGTHVLVDVRGTCWQRKDTLPDVTAEVARSGATWVFVNFRDPRDTTDLLKTLDGLRRERDSKPAQRRPH